MSETVFQLRPGFVPLTRSPRRDQPCARRMPVLQYDSSRKTSLRAATAVTRSEKRRLRSRFSGESRSVATDDFFFVSTRVDRGHASRPSETF